ncbi:D-lactate dehydrogenase, partial [Acinetobacter baumannii]
MQTFSPKAVIERLQNIVGRSYVLTDDQSTRQYRQGRRFGEGKVLAVVVPGTLLEQWQVLQAAIEADCIVIMQAANTGLTGGSTPYGDDYDRPVLVMST